MVLDLLVETSQMMDGKDKELHLSETPERESDQDVPEKNAAQSSPNMTPPTDEAFGPEPDLLDKIIPVVGHQQQIHILRHFAGGHCVVTRADGVLFDLASSRSTWRCQSCHNFDSMRCTKLCADGHIEMHG